VYKLRRRAISRRQLKTSKLKEWEVECNLVGLSAAQCSKKLSRVCRQYLVLCRESRLRQQTENTDPVFCSVYLHKYCELIVYSIKFNLQMSQSKSGSPFVQLYVRDVTIRLWLLFFFFSLSEVFFFSLLNVLFILILFFCIIFFFLFHGFIW
jgi:hypothetical protein